MIVSMEFFKTVEKQIIDKINRLAGKIDNKLDSLDSKIVQSDWATNDPEDLSYINNRICYSILTPEVVLPEIEFVVNNNNSYNTNLGYYVIKNIVNDEMFANARNAAEIDVTYDGIVYKNVSVSKEEVYIGSGGYATMINIGKIDETPFYIQIADSGSNSRLYVKTTGTHTISITKLVGTYKKIDGKYLNLCKDYNEFSDDSNNNEKIVSNNLLREYDVNISNKYKAYYITLYYNSDTNNKINCYITYDNIVSFINDGRNVFLKYSDQIYVYNATASESLSFINVSINDSNDEYIIKSLEIREGTSYYADVIEKEPIYLSNDYTILNSSTPDSTKKFKITVDDTGTLSATEVTT